MTFSIKLPFERTRKYNQKKNTQDYSIAKLPKLLKVTMVNFRTIYIESDVNTVEVTIKISSELLMKSFKLLEDIIRNHIRTLWR
jgi:hypothetical protein